MAVPGNGGRRYALVVGIDEYDDDSIASLQGAVRDARAIHDLLVDPEVGGFDRVWVLENEQATLSAIKTHLDRHMRAAADQISDTVVVYFAGHGYSNYILAHDTHRDSLFATALPMADIAYVFDLLPSNKMLVLLDTCFSGQAGGRTIPHSEAVDPRQIASGLGTMAGHGRLIIAAAGAAEIALEDADGGVFTRCLIDGVTSGSADLNGDGLIDIHELQGYLLATVAERTGNAQNALSKGELARPFPLFRVKRLPAAPPVLTFIGTQGGVGKTMLVNRTADLLARSQPDSTILLIDLDLQTANTTILRTRPKPIPCTTVYEYVTTGTAELESLIDVTHTVGRSDPIARKNTSRPVYDGDSRVLLLPGVQPRSPTFLGIKDIAPHDFREVVRGLIEQAVDRFSVSHVILDCEAKIDIPYTATAAVLADHLFVVGRDEPASWDQFDAYLDYVREHFPRYTSPATHHVLNKLRPGAQPSVDVTMAIPDVAEYGDPFADRLDVATVRDALLDQYVLAMLAKASVIDGRRDRLGHGVLPPGWRFLLDYAPEVATTKLRPYRWVVARAWARWPLMVLSSAVTAGIAYARYWQPRRERLAALQGLVNEGEVWIVRSLETKQGRTRLSDIARWFTKMSQKEKP